MSTNGPALFSDIGKRARDLLNNGFSTDQKISFTTFSETGVAISSSLANKGGFSVGDVAAQYKYKNATVDVKADTETTVSTKLTVTDVLPSTKASASIKFPDYNSGKLEAQYLHQHASFTTAVGLNKSPAVDFSVTTGTPTIAFGAEASYSTTSREFSKYTGGFSFSNPDISASIILSDKADTIKASYLQHLNQLNGGAVVAEVSRRFSTDENTLTVGGSCVVDPQTTVKARLNNHGHLSALLQHEVRPKSIVILSCSLDTKTLQKEAKFGLSLSLRP